MSFGRRFLNLLFAVLLVAALTVSLHNRSDAAASSALPATAEEATPLVTGDAAPRFTVRTVDGDAYLFDPADLEKPTVLISFRGGWCPYCNLHLSELRKAIPEVREMGLDVLFISNDRPDQLYSGLEREAAEDIANLDYTILSDADLEAARAFGTAFSTTQGLTNYLDRKKRDYEGSSIEKYNALGIPFVYVVDTSGRIVFDFVEPNYKVRISPEELKEVAANAIR